MHVGIACYTSSMIKRLSIGLAVIVLLFIGFAAIKGMSNSGSRTSTEELVRVQFDNPVKNISEKEAQNGYIFTFNGDTYSVIGGCNAYQQSGGSWNLIDQICYDPNYKSKYSNKNGRMYIKADDGRDVEIPTRFSRDFENDKSIKDLFITDVGQIGFTAMTLQSPKAPEVSDYVKLRNCILAAKCDFLDNRIDLSKDVVHSGKQSVKFLAVAPNKSIETSKSSIETQLVYFRKGDDVWFEGWYYFQEGLPTTIMDLESTWLKSYPGPRIWVNQDKTLEIELKALDKPRYKQTGAPLPLPIKKWVRIVIHYKLSNTNDGVIQLWQDDKKIIDARGKNIPFPDTILNSLEVGISANSNSNSVILYVDDISIGKTPPNGY